MGMFSLPRSGLQDSSTGIGSNHFAYLDLKTTPTPRVVGRSMIQPYITSYLFYTSKRHNSNNIWKPVICLKHRLMNTSFHYDIVYIMLEGEEDKHGWSLYDVIHAFTHKFVDIPSSRGETKVILVH